MANIEKILVPDIGDFDSVDVVEVLVGTGDTVAVDDSLISLESDKATMDVPSPKAGVVQDVKIKAGDQVAEGDLILTLEVVEEAAEPAESEPETTDDGEAAPEAPVADETATGSQPRPAAVSDRPTRASSLPSIDEEAFAKAYASPSVRRFARELGVDLGRVRGTGRKGRILKDDVQGWVKGSLAAAEVGGTGLPEMPVVDFSVFGEVERRPLTRIQKISGSSVHRSWLHVPHVTQHDETDVTELEAFRKSQAKEAERRGVKLTPLAFVMRACVAMLREFPTLNSSLDADGEHLILKRYVHLGFAADTDQGLLVPVIRNADSMGVWELAEALGDLSERAREGKLRPDEMKGASFTVSSLGGIGGTAFTPIVNAPEVAILGVSKIQIRPVWDGEGFAPRKMLPLSLSYDHRVIDGALAVRATTSLSAVLADIRRLLL